MHNSTLSLDTTSLVWIPWFVVNVVVVSEGVLYIQYWRAAKAFDCLQHCRPYQKSNKEITTNQNFSNPLLLNMRTKLK